MLTFSKFRSPAVIFLSLLCLFHLPARTHDNYAIPKPTTSSWCPLLLQEALRGAGTTRAAATQEDAFTNLRIHLGDWRDARRLMLEDILTVQESGVFNELLWACDGTVWDTVGCSALRDAIFCLSNYYLIDRLNVKREFSRANWINRDGGQEGLLELLSWCQAEVPIWHSGSTANCKDAMSHLSLKFPSTQCRRLHRVVNFSPPGNVPKTLLLLMAVVVPLLTPML